MNQCDKAENGFPNQNGDVGYCGTISRLVSPEISPKTPEQDEVAGLKRMSSFTKAPKNKFIGPPIMKVKIKPTDAVSNGISGEQCKTIKSTNRILLRPHNSSTATTKGPTSFNYSPPNQANTQISTVHVSKGIAMKRIDKVVPYSESSTSRIGNGSVHRSQNKKAHSKTGVGSSDLKSGIGSSDPKTRVGSNDPKTRVGSSDSKARASSSGKMSEDHSKPNVRKEKKTIATPAVPLTILKSNSSTPDDIQAESVQSVDSCRLTSSNANAPFEPYGYKTLEEFLGMPEVEELNYKKNENENKPKQLFKSQFWDYLDPRKKREDSRYTVNKEKPYDPVEVKSYMEKQKEIRKLKEAREYAERQQELERKKKLLVDLNAKCRSINARRLVSRKSLPSTAPTPTESQVVQKKPKSHQSESAVVCSSVKSPSTRHSEPSKGKHSSEQDMNATILLKEFEDIVKKECMQVLKHHMSKIPGEPSPPKPQTYDKAVETTISLERNGNIFSCSKDSTHSSVVSSLTDDAEFIRRLTAGHRLSQSQVNRAATKIQSWFRGCYVRKQLREANIIPYLSHKKDARRRRRMSFYRTPEKPYDSPMQRRLSCVSPARIPAIAQAYIPAKENSAFNQVPFSPVMSSAHRHSMPTSLRLKPFDEPFPKEVIEKIQQKKQQLIVIQKTGKKSGYSSDDFVNTHLNYDGVNWQPTSCQYGSQYAHLQRQFVSESPLAQLNVNTYKPVTAPTIAEVLKEKVRAFSQELQTREMIKGSLPKKSSSENYVHNGYQNTDPRHKFDSEIESYSEPQSTTPSFIKDHSGGGRASGGAEIPEKNVGTEVDRSRIHRRNVTERRKKRLVYDSTTTVDTDVDLVSSTSRQVSMASSSPEFSLMKSNTEHNGTAVTSTNIPTSSVNIQSLPTPALELCYKAELERMQVLEKAYQCTLNHERRKERREKHEQETKHQAELDQAKVENERRQLETLEKLKREQVEIKEMVKKRLEPQPQPPSQSSDVNLALMNCQKEALNATAEIAKLMSDLKKSSLEKDYQDFQQQPVKLATMVYAAVDEARRRDDEKRKKRREIEKKRALKEKVEREIPPREVRVMCQDKQVQFPTSSMCDSSLSSAAEQVSSRRHRRNDVVRDTKMESVREAKGQLEKHLQQAKKVLQGIHTDEDVSENLSELDSRLPNYVQKFERVVQSIVEQRSGTDDDKNSEEQSKRVTQHRLNKEYFHNDEVINEKDLPSSRVESSIVTEKDVLTETPQSDIEIEKESSTNLDISSSIHSVLSQSSEILQLSSPVDLVVTDQVKSVEEVQYPESFVTDQVKSVEEVQGPESFVTDQVKSFEEEQDPESFVTDQVKSFEEEQDPESLVTDQVKSFDEELQNPESFANEIISEYSNVNEKAELISDEVMKPSKVIEKDVSPKDIEAKVEDKVDNESVNTEDPIELLKTTEVAFSSSIHSELSQSQIHMSSVIEEVSERIKSFEVKDEDSFVDGREVSEDDKEAPKEDTATEREHSVFDDNESRKELVDTDVGLSHENYKRSSNNDEGGETEVPISDIEMEDEYSFEDDFTGDDECLEDKDLLVAENKSRDENESAIDEAKPRDDENREEIENKIPLKEKEEREIPPREVNVTCQDKQVQLATSSMGDSSLSSAAEQVPNRSVKEAKSQPEKNLQQAKEVLQDIQTDEDISENLSEYDSQLSNSVQKIESLVQNIVEQPPGTDDDRNSEEQAKRVTQHRLNIDYSHNDEIINEKDLPSPRVESSIVTEKDIAAETPQSDVGIEQEPGINLETDVDRMNAKAVDNSSSIHSISSQSSDLQQLSSPVDQVVTDQVKSSDKEIQDPVSFKNEVISGEEKPSKFVEKDVSTKNIEAKVENKKDNESVKAEDPIDLLKTTEVAISSSIQSELSQSPVHLSSAIEEISEGIKSLEVKDEDSFGDDRGVSEDDKETPKEDTATEKEHSVLEDRESRKELVDTDAGLSHENYKRSSNDDEGGETEVPISDVEMEDDEDSFEDDFTEDDECLEDKDHLVAENKSRNENELADDQKCLEKEIVDPEKKSVRVVDEDDNFIVESPHFEIEGEEEEWFEDEMVSDGKEDEALKLEAAKLEEEQNRIENEIRALEALQAQAPPVSQRTNLSDIPDKPPPPYSPPTSDSFSASSRSFVTAVGENKIKDVVLKEVHEIWDVWMETGTLPPLTIEADETNEKPDISDKNGFQPIQQTSNRALDSLLTDFVRQTIRELLLVHDDSTSYVDRVRPGPMALRAQQIRVPQTKEVLIEKVLGITKENLPLGMVSDSNVNPLEYGTAWKKRLTKWSSRPRDQVDEILVEELITENSEWTEFWPEELIVTDRACKKIIRNALSEVLLNLKTASKK